MKNDRLFQLLYLLLENGSMSAPVLSQRLEVSVRTVYRDVETLSAAGVPVYATAGKGGGISIMPGYSFDKTLFSSHEQEQLLFAVQSLQAAGQEVAPLLNKLGAAFNVPRTDWISVEFSRWGMHKADNERFEILKDAILGKKALNIEYCGTSREKTSRIIHPVKLIYKDKSWYLQSFCLKANDFRLFKISRILKIKVTGEAYTQNYTDKLPPLEPDICPPYCNQIKLHFAPEIAFRIYDEFAHEDIFEEPDGSLTVNVSFPLDSWSINYFLSFGTSVEIIEPESAKDMLAAYAEKIYKHHKT